MRSRGDEFDSLFEVVELPIPTSGSILLSREMKCAGTPALTTKCMTRALYDEVSNSVRSLLRELPPACASEACPQADWSGCVLRLAGHDFMDFDSGQQRGGSDGCLNFDDPDNKGLPPCAFEGEFGVSIKDAYAQFCEAVSIADFVVIAGEAVMTELQTGGSLDFRASFQFGRTTAPQCSFNLPLPNPEDGCEAVETVFMKRLGLNWKEAVALMGVHTLGRAQREFSGYDGWWSDPQNSRKFNNQYYASILAKGWAPEKNQAGPSPDGVSPLPPSFPSPRTSEGKTQWARVDQLADSHEMMLNTDMCLAFTTRDSEGAEPVHAGNHKCCSWVFSSQIPAVIQGTNNNKYCGRLGQSDPGTDHRDCCNNDAATFDCQIAGGLPARRPSSDAVLEFARSESAWLQVFKPTWKKVTENGFTGRLKPLSSNCQERQSKPDPAPPKPLPKPVPPPPKTKVPVLVTAPEGSECQRGTTIHKSSECMAAAMKFTKKFRILKGQDMQTTRYGCTWQVSNKELVFNERLNGTGTVGSDRLAVCREGQSPLNLRKPVIRSNATNMTRNGKGAPPLGPKGFPNLKRWIRARRVSRSGVTFKNL